MGRCVQMEKPSLEEKPEKSPGTGSRYHRHFSLRLSEPVPGEWLATWGLAGE